MRSGSKEQMQGRHKDEQVLFKISKNSGPFTQVERKQKLQAISGLD